MELRRVADLAEQVRGVSYSKADASLEPRPGYVPVLRAGNIADDGLEFGDLVYVPEGKVKQKQLVRANDIVIAASSGSLDVVGKAARALDDFQGGFGAFCKVLRPGNDIEPSYFAHYFKTQDYRRKVSNLAAGANINNLRNGDLDELLIPVPPLEDQKRIAKILDAADALRAKRRESLAQLDALLQSTFLDLFGDPVTNPKGWPVVSLSDYGSFKNGLNYRNGESGVGVRCLGVGDFGSRSILADVDKLSLIQLDQLPSSEYFLKDGDLVFVRSNGNRQLVGRCLALYSGSARVTYSGFCIRYRVEKPGLCQAYLTHLFRVASFRKAMLQGGQGANIQNINQKTLSSLNVPMPNEDCQKQFSDVLDSIEGLKASLANHLGELEGLFSALQNKAFSGEL